MILQGLHWSSSDLFPLPQPRRLFEKKSTLARH